jgi:hypothetical protein
MVDPDEDVSKALNAVTDEDLIRALKEFLGKRHNHSSSELESNVAETAGLTTESAKAHD